MKRDHFLLISSPHQYTNHRGPGGVVSQVYAFNSGHAKQYDRYEPKLPLKGVTIYWISTGYASVRVFHQLISKHQKSLVTNAILIVLMVNSRDCRPPFNKLESSAWNGAPRMPALVSETTVSEKETIERVTIVPP